MTESTSNVINLCEHFIKNNRIDAAIFFLNKTEELSEEELEQLHQMAKTEAHFVLDQYSDI